MKNLLCFFILLVFASLLCYANPGRGRVKIAHGTIVTDKGTLLRGCVVGTDIVGYTREQFNSIKEYGLNTCHLGVWNVSDVGTELAASIDSIVKWTEEDSLYLIITPTSGAAWNPLFGLVDSTNYKCTLDFWKFYAPRYKDKTHVIYELVNEPCQYLHSSDTLPRFYSDGYKIMRDSAPDTHIILPIIWSADWDPWHMKAWANIESDIKRLTDRGVDMSNVSISFHTYGFSGIALDSILLCFRALGHSFICTEMPAFFNIYLQDAHLNFKDVKIYEKDSVSYVYILSLSDLSQNEKYKDVLEDYGISWAPDFGKWPYTIKSDTRTWNASQPIGAEWFDIGADSSIAGIYSQLYYVEICLPNLPWIMFKKVDFNKAIGCNIRIASTDATNDDNIELHLDSLTGKKIGELTNFYTGGDDIWQTFSFKIDTTDGIHAIYFVVHGEAKIEWFYFSQESGTSQILQIPKCSTPPVIDGVLDDIWNYTYAVPLLNYQAGLDTPKSYIDHFSTLRTMWDDNYFYAFVHVMDDIICAGNPAPWKNDAIELYFDGGNDKTPFNGVPDYDANDRQWIWVYGIQDTSSLPVSSFWRGPGNWVWKKTAVGYDFELKIPKDSLTFPLVAGHAIGFEIANDDCDNNIQGRTNTNQWWSSSPDAWKDASVFGTALLKDGKLIYSSPPAPVLLACAHNAKDQPTTLTLSWKPSARASTYQLQVATSSNFGSGLVANDSTIIDPVKKVGSLSLNVTYYWRVRAANASGKSGWSEIWQFTTSKNTGVSEEVNIPLIYSLSQNYPNPFNPSTTIKYSLPDRSQVRLQIFNILGQMVKELVNNEQTAGYKYVVWNANVSSGLYIYRLEATSKDNPSKRFINTKKMILIK